MNEFANMLVGDYFLLEGLSLDGQVEMYHARSTTRDNHDVLLCLFSSRIQ